MVPRHAAPALGHVLEYAILPPPREAPDVHAPRGHTPATPGSVRGLIAVDDVRIARSEGRRFRSVEGVAGLHDTFGICPLADDQCNHISEEVRAVPL